jgi:hypothetical protein
VNFDRAAPEGVRLAARRYTEKGTARRINIALRSGELLTEELHLIAAAIDDAFRSVNMTRHDGTVWRFLRGTTLRYPEPGQYMDIERSFTSTTLSEEYARRLMSQEASGDLWEIVVRPPSAVLDVNDLIGSMQSHEDEILLPRGAEFKVISAHPRIDGKPGPIVRMELWAKFTTTV